MSKNNTRLVKAQSFVKKPVAAAIAGEFQIDTQGDADLIEANNNCWDDLNNLKDALGAALVEFVYQVQTMVHTPVIVDNLGDRREEFYKLLAVFDADVNRYASQIAEMRVQHEHLSGSVTSLDDMNMFTNLSMKYQVIQVELQSLMAPTLASLTLLVNEIVPMTVQAAAAKPVTDSVTDAQIKEEVAHVQ